MAGKHCWLPRAATTTALLLLMTSSCGRVSTELSAQDDGGSTNGNAGAVGASGSVTAGGAFASAGAGPGGASVGATAGAGGEAGSEEAAGAGGEAGSGEAAGNGGEGGAGLVCEEGFALCSENSHCTDLRIGEPQADVVLNCGECGTTCSLAHASGTTCLAGACAPTCQSGFANCNAAGNDGCETAITTAENCGTCQRACSHTGATGLSCTSGHCIPVCAPHYADCNPGAQLVHDDGCESYLDALDQCATSCSSASVACGPTQVCNDGNCVAPSGVVRVSVPLTGSAQVHRFADVINAGLNLNLEGATLTVRAYAPGATAGTLVLQPVDGSSAFSPAVLTTDLTSLGQKWTDLSIPLESLGPFAAAKTKQINLEVRAGAAGPWLNPTVVYIDSIRASNLAVNDTFDSSSGNFVSSSMVTVPGTTLSWTQTVP